MGLKKDVYLDAMLSLVPRILSQLNRNASMSTYGCFDREYWNYGVCDTPCARKQEAVLTLALLYSLELPEPNPYSKSDALLSWIEAALDFWVVMQRSSGAFDDLYPYENSYVATAFSAYAVSETLLIVGDKLGVRERYLSALEASGRWLIGKLEPKVANQEAGALAALYDIYLLTGNKRLLTECGRLLSHLEQIQSPEGWFPEYGGADVGYLSVSIDYLAKYFQRSEDERVIPTLERAVDFLQYFVHPDGSAGGEYGSRATCYLIPHGFELMATRSQTARVIAARFRHALKSGRSVIPHSVDDKYLLFNGYTFLQAYRDGVDDLGDSLPDPRGAEFKCHFPHSGLSVVCTENFYLVMSSKKGGAFTLFFKGAGRKVSDSGVLIFTKEGGKVTSLVLSCEGELSMEGNRWSLRSPLWKVRELAMTPVRFASMHLFQALVGRWNFVGQLVKRLLRRLLITGRWRCPGHLVRTITWERNRVKVVDEIECAGEIERVIVGPNLSYAYGESSRYFDPAEPFPVGALRKRVEGVRAKNSFSWERVYDEKARIIESAWRDESS